MEEVREGVQKKKKKKKGIYSQCPKNILKNLQIGFTHHRPSLNIHVPRLVGPLEGLSNKPCRPF